MKLLYYIFEKNRTMRKYNNLERKNSNNTKFYYTLEIPKKVENKKLIEICDCEYKVLCDHKGIWKSDLIFCKMKKHISTKFLTKRKYNEIAGGFFIKTETPVSVKVLESSLKNYTYDKFKKYDCIVLIENFLIFDFIEYLNSVTGKKWDIAM